MIQHAALRPSLALALLSAALLAPAGAAHASEVVKLARLVVTGTRSTGEAAAVDKARIQRLPPVLIEGRRSADGMQLAVQQRRGLPKAL